MTLSTVKLGLNTFVQSQLQSYIAGLLNSYPTLLESQSSTLEPNQLMMKGTLGAGSPQWTIFATFS